MQRDDTVRQARGRGPSATTKHRATRNPTAIGILILVTSSLAFGQSSKRDEIDIDKVEGEWLLAAVKGDTGSMLKTIRDTGKRSLLGYRNNCGDSAITFAALAGRAAAVNLLLLARELPPPGQHPNNPPIDGSCVQISALEAAAYSGDSELVELLCKHPDYSTPAIREDAARMAFSARYPGLGRSIAAGCDTKQEKPGTQDPKPASESKVRAILALAKAAGDAENEAVKIRKHPVKNDGVASTAKDSATPNDPDKPAPAGKAQEKEPTYNYKLAGIPCPANDSAWCTFSAQITGPQLPEAYLKPGQIPIAVETAIRAANAPNGTMSRSTANQVTTYQADGIYRLQYYPGRERLGLQAIAGFNVNKTSASASVNRQFYGLGATYFVDLEPARAANKWFMLLSAHGLRLDNHSSPVVNRVPLKPHEGAVWNVNATLWNPLTLPRSLFGDKFDATYGYAPFAVGLQRQKQSNLATGDPIDSITYRYARLDWIQTVPMFPKTSVTFLRQVASVVNAPDRAPREGGRLWGIQLNFKVPDAPVTLGYELTTGSDPLNSTPVRQKGMKFTLKYVPN